MRVKGLNIGRKKDPRGYYVAIADKETYFKIRDIVERLGLEVEDLGVMVGIRSKSWSKIEKLIEEAKSRGIEVHS